MPVVKLEIGSTTAPEATAASTTTLPAPVFTIDSHELDLGAAAAILSQLAGNSENAVKDDDEVSTCSSSLKATPPSKSRRKQYAKGTEEYKQRRERNNVAVRKSRDKTKKVQAETQQKVKELSAENDRLQKKVDLLSKELSVLKGLFSNIGAVLPDSLKDYFSK